MYFDRQSNQENRNLLVSTKLKYVAKINILHINYRTNSYFLLKSGGKKFYVNFLGGHVLKFGDNWSNYYIKEKNDIRESICLIYMKYKLKKINTFNVRS